MIRKLLYYTVVVLIGLNMMMIALNGLGIVAYRFSTITSYLSRIAILIFIVMFLAALIEFKRTKGPKNDTETDTQSKYRMRSPHTAPESMEHKSRPKAESEPTPSRQAVNPLQQRGAQTPQSRPQPTRMQHEKPVTRPPHLAPRSRDISVRRRRRKIQL